MDKESHQTNITDLIMLTAENYMLTGFSGLLGPLKGTNKSMQAIGNEAEVAGRPRQLK